MNVSAMKDRAVLGWLTVHASASVMFSVPAKKRVIDKAFAVVLELTRKPGAHVEHYLSAINHLRSSS